MGFDTTLTSDLPSCEVSHIQAPPASQVPTADKEPGNNSVPDVYQVSHDPADDEFYRVLEEVIKSMLQMTISEKDIFCDRIAEVVNQMNQPI